MAERYFYAREGGNLIIDVNGHCPSNATRTDARKRFMWVTSARNVRAVLILHCICSRGCVYLYLEGSRIAVGPKSLIALLL